MFRLAIFFILIAGVIVVPFVLWGEAIDGFVTRLLDAEHAIWVMFCITILALAVDVIAPIPSSIVGVIAGGALGVVQGAIAVWLGLTFGCFVGFALGRVIGWSAIDRWIEPKAVSQAQVHLDRNAAMYLMATRAVPVLAETSVLSAGAFKLSFGKFAFLTSIANLPIAVVYAAAGAWAAETNVFWSAVFSVLLVMAIVIFVRAIGARGPV